MNPQLFHIYGPFFVTSYGTFVALGLGLFLAAVYWHPDRTRLINNDQFFDAAAVGIAGGLLGGKLLFLLEHGLHAGQSWGELLQYALGGFAILGAMIGALLSLLIYLWWQGLAVSRITDLVGAYALLAHGVARWGCHFAGCCYGAISAVPWLQVVYSHPASLAPVHVPLYPTQMLMSISSLCGFVLLRYVIYPWRGRPVGTVVVWYLLYESLSRFAIDFLRGDRPMGDGVFSYYQYLAVAMMIACIGVLVALHKGEKE